MYCKFYTRNYFQVKNKTSYFLLCFILVCFTFNQSPVPFGKWEGIKDASKDGNECIQKNILEIFNNTNQETLPTEMPPPSLIIGSEDCLYLNVFTPSVSNVYFSTFTISYPNKPIHVNIII